MSFSGTTGTSGQDSTTRRWTTWSSSASPRGRSSGSGTRKEKRAVYSEIRTPGNAPPFRVLLFILYLLVNFHIICFVVYNTPNSRATFHQPFHLPQWGHQTH